MSVKSLQYSYPVGFNYNELLSRSCGSDFEESQLAARVTSLMRSGHSLTPDQLTLLFQRDSVLWSEPQRLHTTRNRSADPNQKVVTWTGPRDGCTHLCDVLGSFLDEDDTCFDAFLEKNTELLNTHRKQFVLPSAATLGCRIWFGLSSEMHDRWHHYADVGVDEIVDLVKETLLDFADTKAERLEAAKPKLPSKLADEKARAAEKAKALDDSDDDYELEATVIEA